jgi:hypothetical protein
MPIEVDCPHCGQRHDVPFTHAGHTQPCAACGQTMRVPTPRAMVRSKSDSERPQIITPDDLFEMAYDRAVRSLKWLVSRPLRLVLLSLAVIAGGLGIGAAKWALHTPEKSAPAPPPHVDPEPWEGVGLSDTNGHVRVTAESIKIDRMMLRSRRSKAISKSPKAFLIVALKIENLSRDEPIQYSGWDASAVPADQVATLKDDQGGVLRPFDGGEEVMIDQATPGPIPASGSIKDIVAFEFPQGKSAYVRLALPGKSVGATGDLRIKIPRTQSDD